MGAWLWLRTIPNLNEALQGRCRRCCRNLCWSWQSLQHSISAHCAAPGCEPGTFDFRTRRAVAKIGPSRWASFGLRAFLPRLGHKKYLTEVLRNDRQCMSFFKSVAGAVRGLVTLGSCRNVFATLLRVIQRNRLEDQECAFPWSLHVLLAFVSEKLLFVGPVKLAMYCGTPLWPGEREDLLSKRALWRFFFALPMTVTSHKEKSQQPCRLGCFAFNESHPCCGDTSVVN